MNRAISVFVSLNDATDTLVLLLRLAGLVHGFIYVNFAETARDLFVVKKTPVIP